MRQKDRNHEIDLVTQDELDPWMELFGKSCWGKTPSQTIAFHGLAKISTFKLSKPFKFDFFFVNYSHVEANPL